MLNVMDGRANDAKSWIHIFPEMFVGVHIRSAIYPPLSDINSHQINLTEIVFFKGVEFLLQTLIF